jgi:hypothetical protein
MGLFAIDFHFPFSNGIELSPALANDVPMPNIPSPFSGSITLNQVTANANGREGAVLLSMGDIKVSNSQFNRNDGVGLYAGTQSIATAEPVLSNVVPFPIGPFPFSGNITLNQVTANTNGLGGAILESDGNINIFHSQFNGNGADARPYCEGGECYYWFYDGGVGLTAASWAGSGQIQLDKVQASNNFGDGAWLIGDDVIVRKSTFHNNGLGQASLGSDVLWADGLYIEDLGGSSAYLKCVKANGNAAYGIEIITGDITLNSASAHGNGWDDFNLQSDTLDIFSEPCGNPKAIPDLPWQIVPVTGDENIELNCSAYIGTVLVLPNGDEIRLPCPTIGDASLTSLSDNDLPRGLTEGNSFVSSFTAQVVQGGVNLETLPAAMIVSFLVPDDMLDTDLAILYWNGSEWIEVAGGYLTTDGRFEASVNFTGDFVLVSK